MKEQIGKLDAAFQANNFPELANNFERIGNAEKNQWLPFYYAAYCQVMTAFLEQDKSKVVLLSHCKSSCNCRSVSGLTRW